MTRLGLHLSLRSGREALTRLLVTTAAVAVGVTLLLSVLAIYHGYQTTIDRACWTCTGLAQHDTQQPTEQPAPSAEPRVNAELWHYTEDVYQGQAIDRLDVAALGPDAPLVPGLTRLPGAGEYYVSPAMAKLLATVPHEELGDRFPGTQVGVIGQPGLSGPQHLAIIIGYAPTELAKVPNTIRVTAIQTAPRSLGNTSIYGFGFVLGAIALLLPMLILIGNASRLAAARREERYAAMRLVGATPRQIGVIASVDAVVGALLGSLVGVGVFAAIQSLVARVSVTGSPFFTNYVTPTATSYVAVLVGVPLAAAIVSVLSLRRVGISPLGVSRRATPPPPRAWRVVPLAVGLVVFILPLALGDPANPNVAFAATGLALIMIGLMVGGTWLTMQAARLLARFSPGASSLLASRRMADNPKVAFRSVSGLVLAVFVGTLLAGAVPAALAAQRTPTDTSLNNVLRIRVGGSPQVLDASTVARITNELQAFDGVSVLTLYSLPPDGNSQGLDAPPSVIDCDSLAHLNALGHCAPGATAVEADTEGMLLTDSIGYLNRLLPLVTDANPLFSGDVTTFPVNALLIKVEGTGQLERIRTLLTAKYPWLTGGLLDSGPRTFGEVAEARAELYTTVGRVVLLIAGMTLLVAGCSLAIAMGGGMVERKRPFTLLRVSGTPTRVLRRVVLLESVLPLVTATVVAAVAGFAAAIPVGRTLLPPGSPAPIQFPGQSYYLTMGLGLSVSLAIIALTLPLLNRITVPANVRFE
jgi:hypothetical protein